MYDEGVLLGRGVHFPPTITANGRWAWSSGAENIRQSIQIILRTEPMQRLMLKEFGTGLRQFLFRDNTVATRGLIEETIAHALQRWEPRIKVIAVEVRADPEEAETALITVRYSLVLNSETDQVQLSLRLGS
jgi:phage baseplate assembly protein W